MSRARLTLVRKEGGGARLVLELSAGQLERFRNLAEQRGVCLAEYFGEAFRLQEMFTEGIMYIKDGEDLRELVKP